MFYSKSTNGFYDSKIHKKFPEDCVEITPELYLELLEGQCNGKLINSDSYGVPFLEDNYQAVDSTAETERQWRDQELERSDIELNKVQDSDPKAIGTVSLWREYRKSLRAWPENKDFPNKTFRPKAMDV